MFLTFLCSNPPSIHTLPPHIRECVCVEQESLFNGRDRGPWGLSSPTAEGFRGKAGGCSVNSSGLNNACVPSAPDPPTTNIRSGRKRMIKGDKRVCVCVRPVSHKHTHTYTQSRWGSGDLRDQRYSVPFCCSTFTLQPALLKPH